MVVFGGVVVEEGELEACRGYGVGVCVVLPPELGGRGEGAKGGCGVAAAVEVPEDFARGAGD